MISLLGSLLGFGSSLIGPVLDAWNRSANQKHELAMLHAQAEVQSKLQDQRLEATMVEADMAEIVAAHKEQAATVRKGPQWLAALSGSVRPVVTYLIIVEWLAINWAIAWLIIDEEGITVYNLQAYIVSHIFEQARTIRIRSSVKDHDILAPGDGVWLTL